MKIQIKYLEAENFKGCKHIRIDFKGKITIISGPNASGKTTIFDAFRWALFDEDSSGSSKFYIRHVEKDGTTSHNTEISVTVGLAVDETDLEFKKIQKEKWTKKRGSESKELTANTNDFYINGFPKSKKEYDEKVTSLLNEDDFKLLTDVKYFPNLKPKDKREKLLQVIGDYTPQMLLDSDPERWKLIRSDVLEGGINGTLDKAKKILSRLKKEQEEVPIRIDEAKRQLREEIDVDDVKRQVDALKEKKDGIAHDIDVFKSENDKSQLQRDLDEAIRNSRKIEWEGQLRLDDERSCLSSQIRSCEGDIESARRMIVECEHSMTLARSLMDDASNGLTQCKINYRNLSEEEFSDADRKCKYCGQELPADKLATAAKMFYDRRNELLEEENKKGEKYAEIILKKKEEYKKLSQDIIDLNMRIHSDEDKIKDCKTKLDLLPEKPDLSANSQYLFWKNSEKTLQEKIDSCADISEKIKEKEFNLIEIDSALRNDYQRIYEADAIRKSNEDVQERIENLEIYQRDLGQKTADQEHIVILCEEFSRRQSEMLTEKINSQFEKAKFSMFNRQLNGGIMETCEITYNGVRYDALNNGHKITVALDIIKTFQRILGVTAPVWLDNAECLSTDNQPDMDGQMIMLKVTDGEGLKVS